VEFVPTTLNGMAVTIAVDEFAVSRRLLLFGMFEPMVWFWRSPSCTRASVCDARARVVRRVPIIESRTFFQVNDPSVQSKICARLRLVQ
jgi:hypothetical protein